MTEVDRLRVVYELLDQQFRAGMDRMRNSMRTTNSDIIAQASRAERGVTSSFKGMAAGAAVAVAGVVSVLAALNKLGTYAQNYRQVENRLRSLGEYSDDAAERLTAAALRSRTDLTAMADGVARVQKATGAGYDETIRRVETLNKLMTMGGSSGAEVSSVMIQLSQALSSGILQGDELRSLREAAPVELLDAIAKAAGGTRDQLKQMGEEGQLTSAVIVAALDTMAATADAGFSRMAPTVADGWTNITTALTTFIGRADEGLGATSALAQGMMDLSTWLASNADLAEEVGISVQAALGTFSEYADAAVAALGQLSDFLNSSVNEAVNGTGDSFNSAGLTAGDAIAAIIDALATMNGALEGTAAAVTEAFLKIPDAITGALQSAINAVIGAVEAMVNAVLDGVRSVAAQVDAVTGAVAGLTGGAGTNLAGGIGNVTLPRTDSLATSFSSRSAGEAYRSSYDRGAGTVYAAADAVEGFFDGVSENYERRKANLKKAADESDQTPPGVVKPQPPALDAAAAGGGAKKAAKGGRKGGGSKGTPGPSFADVLGVGQDDVQDLERKIQLIGLTSKETATLEAKWAMLDAAKKAGVPINDQLNGQIEAQAQQVGQLTADLENAKTAQDDFNQAMESIANAFTDAILGGESLRDSLASIFKQIAANILNAGIQNALSQAFSGAGGGGGGFLGAIGSAIVGGLSGKRASGGSVRAGGAYLVNENTPNSEVFVPSVNGAILNVAQAQAALRGQAGGGNGQLQMSASQLTISDDGRIMATVTARIAQASRSTLSQVPGVVSEHNKRRG